MDAPIKTSFERRVFRSASIVIALASLALLPKARAVVPPPDGGYPGFNTAEGTNALKNLTTGVGNAAVGWYSLFSNTDGSFNTALGAGTLLFNVGDQSTGDGTQNTAIGAAALLSNTTGTLNTAVGATALLSNNSGDFNTATGVGALYSNASGVSNNAFGCLALGSNTTGNNNTAIGVRALQSNTEGGANVALGETALSSNATASANTAIGYAALSANTTGVGNTALGYNAGIGITMGSGNVCIGAGVIGTAAEFNTTRIANIGTTPLAAGTTVLLDAVGGTKLGYLSSSRRNKDDIKPMDNASEAIYSLRPVSFRYKPEIEPTGVQQYGLIAENVEEVSPDLVVRDQEGKAATLRFEAINAMLLNEFLKEHRKVQELEKAIATLTAQFKEQAAQIHKISGRLEMNNAAPRMTASNP